MKIQLQSEYTVLQKHPFHSVMSSFTPETSGWHLHTLYWHPHSCPGSPLAIHSEQLNWLEWAITHRFRQTVLCGGTLLFPLSFVFIVTPWLHEIRDALARKRHFNCCSSCCTLTRTIVRFLFKNVPKERALHFHYVCIIAGYNPRLFLFLSPLRRVWCGY
mgnify:FL=1